MLYSQLKLPADLHGLSVGDLERLAEDIRQVILNTSLKNGGHLGASLGAVEIALGLHATFKSPEEPIVWDVGHQAYAHKLITGRWLQFETLRKTGGISGFLSRMESEHDVFGAGHSSTALSAALAMAWARGHDPKLSHLWTVAVVGDGGLTAGVALEALNNVRAQGMGPLLLVLNDNQMSISPNVGAIPAILAGGQGKELFNLFGFDYVGPINGHDLNTLLSTLQGIRQSRSGRPVLLHVLTQKGKGYIPAEERPAAYHGVSPIQAKVGEPASGGTKKSYSDVFGETVCSLAAEDPMVVVVTAAMTEGTGLVGFAERFPDRFFDVGIAEPHAVTFAAGLATQGYKPIVAIYSTFLQRALDGIIHDVALQNLGVTFAVDRAGIVGADGPTHHGAFDLGYLGMIPGLNLSGACCLADMNTLFKSAVNSGKPWAIRYPRGSGPEKFNEPHGNGLRWHQKPSDPRLIVVAFGSTAGRVVAAAKSIDSTSEKITVISTTQAQPLSADLLDYLKKNLDVPVISFEDGSVRGGFGQALIAKSEIRSAPFIAAGYSDQFIPHGSPADLEEVVGLSQSAIANRMREFLR